MERFVRLVAGGGVTLLAGLWVLEFTAALSVPWTAGLVLSGAGAIALAAGVATPLDR